MNAGFVVLSAVFAGSVRRPLVIQRLPRYRTALCVLEFQKPGVEGVNIGVQGSSLVVLSHAILHPIGQKQRLRAVECGLVSALVHCVFHLGMND